MSVRLLALPFAALALIASGAPREVAREDAILAERRLEACLAASAGDGQATFAAALAAARAACRPQIERVRAARVRAATAGLAPEAARVVERRVTRKLNSEIAHAVARLTGLALPDAQDR